MSRNRKFEQRRNSKWAPAMLIACCSLMLISCKALKETTNSSSTSSGGTNNSAGSHSKDNCCKKESLAATTEAVANRDKGVTVQTNTRPVTVVGEVIDAWCYSSGVMGEGRGEAHKKCARLCVSGGVSAGLLDDQGNVYIAAKYQGYKGCSGLLLPFVGKRVKAKGWVAERGGVRVMKIGSVELETKAAEESESSTGSAAKEDSSEETKGSTGAKQEDTARSN
ncbi:MAG: hypothetical protein K2Z81_21275 [Cyanobacteria bacterium]|nr:hypothetical protein [Cyanobacteriota bacterium]